MFIITNQALNQLNRIYNNDSYFRITIDSGGCSGFSYRFNNESNILDTDVILYENEYSLFKIVTDADSESFLEDAQLSFIDDLTGSYFKLDLKNASSYCGCGTSFSI